MGAWLDQHACRAGRQSWSARPGSSGTALTRGARSGSLHVSREVGLPAVLAYEGKQQPTLDGGPHRVQPSRLVRLPLCESGPLGVPGLHPRQRPPSGSAILIIWSHWTWFDDLWLGRPVRLSAFSAFGGRQRWRDGVAPVLMAGWSAGTAESQGLLVRPE